MARQASQRKQQQQQLRHQYKQPLQSVTTSSSPNAPPPPAPLPLPPHQLVHVAPSEARLKPIRPRMILPAPSPGEPQANATPPAIPATMAATNGPAWPPVPMLPVLPVPPVVVPALPLLENPVATDDTAALASVAVEALSSLSVAAFVMENINKKKLSTKKRIRLKTERRREQCRANQARYRNKQRDHEVELEEYVVALRQEVQALELHKQQLLAKSSSGSTSDEAASSIPQAPSIDTEKEHQLFPMQLVKEYFRLFEHGLSTDISDATTADHQLEMKKYQQQQEQIAFLESVMDPALQFGDFVGVDALVGQWRKYSRCFDDLHLELVHAVAIEKTSLGNGDDDGPSSTTSQSQQHQMMIISTTARLTLTFTHETILRVFPHLVQTSHLHERLVGTRVGFDSVSEFEFEVGDDQAHKVRRLNCTVDFVKSLLALLGNLADVVTVLEQAHIINGYYLCD